MGSDFENEELRVQVNTLRYELDNLKQERDLTELRHEKELRELQLRADSDFRKAQVGGVALFETFLMLTDQCFFTRVPKPQAIEQAKRANLWPKN
jgi:hypothetical protein